MASAEQEHDRELAELRKAIEQFIAASRRYRESELVRKANRP